MEKNIFLAFALWLLVRAHQDFSEIRKHETDGEGKIFVMKGNVDIS
jgi:hypothetical protein